MKDDHHIDELIRQKFEGFEPTPPESVWEKVRVGISPPGSSPKGGYFTLPVITGLIVLTGLLGLLYLISRMESSTQARAGNILTLPTDQFNSGPLADLQLADASSSEILPQSSQEPGPASHRIIPTQIPSRKPNEGNLSHENDQQTEKPAARTTFTQNIRSHERHSPPERFATDNYRMESRNMAGDLTGTDYLPSGLGLRHQGKFARRPDYIAPIRPEWSIGFHFAPEVAFYSSDDINNGINYSIQVLPRISFRNWYVAPGLGFRTGGDQGNYLVNYNKYLGTYEDVYQVTFDSTENGIVPTYHTQTVDVYDTVPYYSISETRATYYYLDVPVLFGKEWTFSKISLYVNAGPSVSILMGRSTPAADYPDEHIRILNESPQVPAREQFNWQLMAGAGFGYRVSNQVSFSLEPTFRYYLTNDYVKGEMNTRHPYSFGIRAGLIYHINH